MARRRLGPPGLIPGLSPEAFASAPPLAQGEALSLSQSLSPAAAPDGVRVSPGLAPARARAEPSLDPLPPRGSRPPIASIAGQSAAEAALSDLAEDLRRAREEGRLVQTLPLEQIDESHLVRDRIVVEGEELEALKTSLRDRGQQMPIEVVDLGQGRFGLISGWRRLTALRHLAAEDPARFGTVLALLRRPAGSAEAYRAMVEENEIRVGLSYYERARIAARAVAQGVFADSFAALAGLFPTASRAKRSKIGSFIRIYEALDPVLRFPAAIPERLGLELAKALEDPALAQSLRDQLQAAAPSDAMAEQAVLASALAAPEVPQPSATVSAEAVAKAGTAGPDGAAAPVSDGAKIKITFRPGKLVLAGAGVDAALAAALEDWLRRRERG